MKAISIMAIVWSFVISSAMANSSLYFKASHIDGLPSRFFELGILGKDLASSNQTIDLAIPFRSIGCNIDEGCTIIYHPRTGLLIRNLDEHSHKIVDEFIDTIYRADNLLVTARAYCELLEPLSAEDRLRTVMRIGFLPDPLVASMIDEIRKLKSVPNVGDDPFAKPEQEPAQLTAAEVERISRLEKATSLILDIALERLKKQLAVMDASKAEQSGTAKPAAPSKDEAPVQVRPPSPPAADRERR